MDATSTSHTRARVLIAGGGIAALESALALKALVGEGAQLTLISPRPEFVYRPAATVQAFGDGRPHDYPLEAIAGDLAAKLYTARLEAVASKKRSVRLSTGVRLPYDALILATGARAVASIPGALTFRDQRDVPLLRRMLRKLEAGAISRAVFAVPSGVSWPLPLYEVALLSAERAERRGADTEFLLVSPEPEPLAVFGSAASRLVADALEERGVRFVGGAAPSGVRRDGALMVQSDGAIRADCVVAAPQLRAARLTGVPASWWGFVPTDAFGRVEGLDDVYAAGDMTTYPIKQGGLATQQADRIAHVIAGSLGSPVKELRSLHVLQARLIGGPRPLALRTELDWRGRPTAASLEYAEVKPCVPTAKVFGRYLRPYLEARDLACGEPAAA
jgi:sulfide:quinone oxidoreductase